MTTKLRQKYAKIAHILILCGYGDILYVHVQHGFRDWRS